MRILLMALLACSQCVAWCDSITVFPDPNPETTSVDGFARTFNGGGADWATIRSANGNSSDDTTNNEAGAEIIATAAGNTYVIVTRGFFLFDTSGLSPEILNGKKITAAKMEVICTAKVDSFGSPLSIALYKSNLNSNTAVISSDFENNVNNNERQAADKTIASFVSDNATYNTFNLNGGGLSRIAVNGISKYGMKVSADIDNSEPVWVANANASITVRYADEPGTDKDPKLTVFYSYPNQTVIRNGIFR